MLEKWDKKLSKSSIEAGIYIEWQNQLFLEVNKKFIPENVSKYIYMQLFKVIERISEMNINERKELLNQTFNSSIDNLKEKFGENPDNWDYGQEDFKHV